MGTPYHYSLELPERCLALVDALWPTVEATDHADRFGGPLTTTFLLAIATPMVVLPVERIQKHLWRKEEGLADDRALSPGAGRAVMTALGSATEPVPFAKCPLFRPGVWSYAFAAQRFNVARGLPDDVAGALNDPLGADRAGAESALEMVLALRNALSHGGILYLNQRGFSTDRGEPVGFLAFVGEKRVDRKFAGLHVLRISEADFRECLRSWVQWLSATRLSRDLAA